VSIGESSDLTEGRPFEGVGRRRRVRPEPRVQPPSAASPPRARPKPETTGPRRKRQTNAELELAALERLQAQIDELDAAARRRFADIPPSIIDPVATEIQTTAKSRTGRYLAGYRLQSIAGRFVYHPRAKQFYFASNGEADAFSAASEADIFETYTEWLALWVAEFVHHLRRTSHEEQRRRYRADVLEHREKGKTEFLSLITVPLVSVSVLFATPVGWLVLAVLALALMFNVHPS
jgi:hypothetical protein